MKVSISKKQTIALVHLMGFDPADVLELRITRNEVSGYQYETGFDGVRAVVPFSYPVEEDV